MSIPDEEKLSTLADLEAFLKASGCSMRAKPGAIWLVEIYRGRVQVAVGFNHNFVTAIREACAMAMAELPKLKSVEHAITD